MHQLTNMLSCTLAFLTAPITSHENLTPLHVILITVASVLVFQKLRLLLTEAEERQRLISALIRMAMKYVPGMGSAVAKEQASMGKKARNAYPRLQSTAPIIELPKQGVDSQGVLKMLQEIKQEEMQLGHETNNQLSGAIYMHDKEHEHVLHEAYRLYMHTNTLHADVFPSGRKFESEIVAMTAKMMQGDTVHGKHCGCVTSGGTESILMAIKTYRDWARVEKGITRPEIVVPVTAHAAFDKGCHYFGIKLRSVPVNMDTMKVDPRAMDKACNGNTILIVGSAPHFPHGIVDPIPQLAEIAKRRKIGLHVDCCLGGFFVPFAKKLGVDVCDFDFSVDGVTSISADTHKYGMAPKGSSVLLFSDRNIRKHMYYVAPRWTGGIYATPTMGGSKPGVLLATCWASMLRIGENGYMKATERMLDTAMKIKVRIRDEIPELKLVGDPKLMVVAFASGQKAIDVFAVGDRMSKRGWNLNSLQFPSSVHICITNRTIGCDDKFIKDLKGSIVELKDNPSLSKSGMAPIYGAAIQIPDASLVSGLVSTVMDALLDVDQQ